jgi:hypothetical protein
MNERRGARKGERICIKALGFLLVAILTTTGWYLYYLLLAGDKALFRFQELQQLLLELNNLPCSDTLLACSSVTGNTLWRGITRPRLG